MWENKCFYLKQLSDGVNLSNEPLQLGNRCLDLWEWLGWGSVFQVVSNLAVM